MRKRGKETEAMKQRDRKMRVEKKRITRKGTAEITFCYVFKKS